MKTSLSHLDTGKQEQIVQIVEIIKKEANPEMIKSLNPADQSNA